MYRLTPCLTVTTSAGGPSHDQPSRVLWPNRAVWGDPGPETVDEDTILARLLVLNLKRSGAPSAV